MANRLAAATSPYLLQHADNPVDWWEWGPEALAEAKRRDIPILLSVGYAACHWCHVMAHDSFEHHNVARVLNEHFVSIKVDREERPDIDAVYMEAVTAMTGQGGWPMTCILTPDAEPFYAGTFFPRAQFIQLLDAVVEAWRDHRADALEAGRSVVAALTEVAVPVGGPPLDADALDQAVGRLGATFDRQHAGFGRAPKFPPSMVLEFLLRQYERSGLPLALAMVSQTGQAMARGGMYDQLAGGFARYSVDEAWVVPHFEKMLYDNALLLRAYLHWWRLTDDPLARRIAHEVSEFIVRDLGTPEGGFASALDADTDGQEGLTYVWTPQQLRDVLGPDDGDLAAKLLAVTADGTFEHGASTLQLRTDPDDPQRWADIRARLLEARTSRSQPARDDKVVTSWTALAISGLAEAGLLFEQPRYLDAAARAAELLITTHFVDGRLRRTSRHRRVGGAAGVAEDYGNLAEALLVLHQATGSGHWLTVAGQLLEVATTRFLSADGGFFDTADDSEVLVRRPRDPTDNATPSGQSSIIMALISYSALTGSLPQRAVAERALAGIAGFGATQPRFLGWALAAAEGLLAGPVEIAIVGETGFGPLTRAAWINRPPGAVVISGVPDAPDVPLLADRPLIEGGPAAYVCRGMVCERPVTTVDDLLAGLG